ncbi:hypothetical protein [Ferroplasma sp.]|uniref:hypothetical protein n=1 Tax=Ferroplasma sp. TaxID=2591003 RepID=UPI00307F060E
MIENLKLSDFRNDSNVNTYKLFDKNIKYPAFLVIKARPFIFINEEYNKKLSLEERNAVIWHMLFHYKQRRFYKFYLYLLFLFLVIIFDLEIITLSYFILYGFSKFEYSHLFSIIEFPVIMFLFLLNLFSFNYSLEVNADKYASYEFKANEAIVSANNKAIEFIMDN